MAVSDDKQNRLSTLSQDVIAVPKKPAAPTRTQESPRIPDPQRTAAQKAIPPSQDVFRVQQPAGQDIFQTAQVPAQPPPAYAPPPQPPAYAPPPPAYAPPPQGYAPPGYGQPPPGYAPPGYGQPPPAYAPPQPPPRPTVRQAPPPAGQSAPMSPMAMVTAVVAVLALGVGLYSATRDTGASGADTVAMEQLAQELKKANERVAKLELALSAAASDSATSPNQANVLQISAGMRELRDDIDGVANDVAKLTAEIGEVRSLAGSASGQAKVVSSQVDQVAARLSTLNEQITNLPKGGGGGGGAPSAETQAQIKALSARTEKMATDIRQLYRLVGGQ